MVCHYLCNQCYSPGHQLQAERLLTQTAKRCESTWLEDTVSPVEAHPPGGLGAASTVTPTHMDTTRNIIIIPVQSLNMTILTLTWTQGNPAPPFRSYAVSSSGSKRVFLLWSYCVLNCSYNIFLVRTRFNNVEHILTLIKKNTFVFPFWFPGLGIGVGLFTTFLYVNENIQKQVFLQVC